MWKPFIWFAGTVVGLALSAALSGPFERLFADWGWIVALLRVPGMIRDWLIEAVGAPLAYELIGGGIGLPIGVLLAGWVIRWDARHPPKAERDQRALIAASMSIADTAYTIEAMVRQWDVQSAFGRAPDYRWDPRTAGRYITLEADLRAIDIHLPSSGLVMKPSQSPGLAAGLAGELEILAQVASRGHVQEVRALTLGMRRSVEGSNGAMPQPPLPGPQA